MVATYLYTYTHTQSAEKKSNNIKTAERFFASFDSCIGYLKLTFEGIRF